MEHPTTLPSSESQKSPTISKKPPPPHKRHTKPCKYYQSSRCPYPADVCNFAHILLPSNRDERSDAICRYYAAGSCHNGSQCRYKHPEDVDVPPPYKTDVLHVSIPESRPGWHGLSSLQDKVPVNGHGCSTSYYPPPRHHDWSYANGTSPQSPVYLPFYQGPAPHPGPMAIGSHDDRHFHHHHHHHHPPPPRLGPPAPTAGVSPVTISTSRISTASTSATTLSFDGSQSDHEDGLSIGSSSSLSSECPSTDLDELIIATTEDPKFAEHVHEYQSQVVVTDQPRPVHVPPPPVFYPVPAPGDATAAANARYYGEQQQGTYQRQRQPQNQHYRTVTPSRYGAAITPARSTRETVSNPVSRTASRNSQRIKPAKYKTKPCKFFAADGTCPTGDECTFRHDEPYPPVPPLPLGLMKPYSGTRPPRTTPPPPRIQLDQAYRMNYSQVYNANVKKDCLPIAWRVIGGGVRVGTNGTLSGRSSSDSELHNNAHGSDSSSESPKSLSDSSDGDEFEYVDSQASGNTVKIRPQSPAPLAIPPTPLQIEPSSGVVDSPGGLKSPIIRKRSNSIPLTPSSTHFIVGNLFSAESPGVL